MKIKFGFTLAEVLITLTIIGVVAALTVPELVKNMNDYAFTKSRDLTLAKITEATNQMKSNDVLSGYATNDAFVSEFQKYMKVTKTCDSTTLVDCFPAKINAGTEGVNTTTLTTGTTLGANNIIGNTIALMLANGTSILFTLRDSTKVSGACDRIDPTGCSRKCRSPQSRPMRPARNACETGDTHSQAPRLAPAGSGSRSRTRA